MLVGGDDSKNSNGSRDYASLENGTQLTSNVPSPQANGISNGHSHHTAFTGNNHNNNPSSVGTTGNGSPHYEMVELHDRHKIPSDLFYHELNPTRTNEMREVDGYALPVTSSSSGHSTIESQPYEVPVKTTSCHQVD